LFSFELGIFASLYVATNQPSSDRRGRKDRRRLHADRDAAPGRAAEPSFNSLQACGGGIDRDELRLRSVRSPYPAGRVVPSAGSWPLGSAATVLVK